MRITIIGYLVDIWYKCLDVIKRRKAARDFSRNIPALSNAELFQMGQMLEELRSRLIKREFIAATLAFALPLLIGAALIGCAVVSQSLAAIVYVYAFPAFIGLEVIVAGMFLHAARRHDRVREQLFQVMREQKRW